MGRNRIENLDELINAPRSFEQNDWEGRHARIQINFDDIGSKWLVMEYANLIV